MKPRRRALLPVLVYCEGIHDQVLMRHLANLYRPDSSRYYFDIKHGDGGSPMSLVEKAHKIPAAYVQHIVIFDNDRGHNEFTLAHKKATEYDIVLHIFSPCLEACLLLILEPSTDFTTWSTTKCKKYFHSKYIPEKKRGDIREYQAILTSTILNAARLRIPELHKKILLFEG